MFFGRDRKVTRALEELFGARKRERGRPFLLVVGASGAGKSSLVRAGLAPRLTALGVAPEIDGWRVAVMRPGGAGAAYAALANALFFNPASKEADDDPGGFGPALPELAATPHKSAADLAALAETSPAAAAATVVAALDIVGEREREESGYIRTFRVDLLLIVDQLEEIFDERVSKEAQIGFARLLTALADAGRIWIAATLRVDLFGRMLDPSLPFLALIDSGGHYNLASPSEAELTEILRKSAEAAGLEYERDPATGEALDERLLQDAKGSNDTLPLLQFSLQELFERRRPIPGPGAARAELTFAAYRELGGLDGAIDKVAEQALADLGSRFAPDEIAAALSRLLRWLAVRVSGENATTSAGPGLTLSAAPRAHVAADPAADALIDVLVANRLMVLESSSQSEPMVRLAHERVLTSWKRAHEITADAMQREFYRVRADVAQRFDSWITGGRRRDLLLSSGKPLIDAEWLIRDYGAELKSAARRKGEAQSPTITDFVRLSGRRARWRQRLTAVAAGVFFVVAVAASGFAWLAVGAERRAERNYAAAKGAADDLVVSIASELRTRKGISSGALDQAFGAVDKLLRRIEQTVVENDGVVGSGLQQAYDWAAARLFGDPGTGQSLADLQLSRAIFLYQFAETYHLSANDLGAARDKAQQSLAIETRLWADNKTPDLADDIAETETELGDIERKDIETKNPIQHQGKSVADFSPARSDYEAALTYLQPIVEQRPERTDWKTDESKLLTKLGDLDMKKGDRQEAASHYGAAHALAQQIFESSAANTATQTEVDAMHELAWSYRKFGELQTDPAAAAQTFADELCVRRHLVALQPENALYAEDLGFTLLKVSGAEQNLKPPDLGSAKSAAYEALKTFVDLASTDPTKKDPFQDVALALRQIGKTHDAAGEKVLADAFAAAAADVQRKTKDAFDKSLTTEAAVSDRALASRGPMAMIETSRVEVENAVNAFDATEKAPTASAACWDRLQQNVGAIPAKP